ncbi:C4-dicarboxylate ABC transporter [Streptococcus mitis]|uniref:C4-dicarboxylate ABC transporter n=1 Tax=Streptococcus mitis TaxID=28037 RepID=A0A081S949_STRMT|nr:TDT family transporter [Streptococcus mitis]KER07452.1 C4-dicarboxylate transporter/malic acid transport family protein [Streptococcus mitis]MBZ2099170.1 TDT family transporter [Streptococcus mitis]MBZ2102941.1 TDT family transporter [Streptococcus mitis]MCC0091785.1 C4-dicarboxylate ABC transporter [Streptococcus mitis]MDU6351790.1 TDT family transporter [Streptococcus mitis]
MKKLPLVFSGCLLGLAGAGNLMLDTLPILSHLLSLTGLILWIYFLILHLFSWKETKQELTKPPLLSGMGTFPMAGMILSTYVFRIFPHLPIVAQGLWWFSFLLDWALIVIFTIKFAYPCKRVNSTPSWTVLYVGIAVAALTYPLVGIIEIAYVTLIFGFLLTFYLYPLIYSDLKKHPLPLALLAQEGIYCAPFSLLLASLVRVGGESLPNWVLIVMILASQSFFFFVLTRLPNILKQGFQPSFSALPFPTISTAIALKMSQGILKLPFLDYLVVAETVICLTILFFVLGAYLIWLRKKV